MLEKNFEMVTCWGSLFSIDFYSSFFF